MSGERVLVGKVASASRPGFAYEVKTDGVTLSCNCPGWTRQVHTSACHALRGQPCSCRSSMDAKTFRTCRHTREIARRVPEAGGLSRVHHMALNQGLSLSDSEAARMPVARPEQTPVYQHLVDEAQRIINAGGPSRVVMVDGGLPISPELARRSYHVTPDLIFIRADGWSLGVPARLRSDAEGREPHRWIGVMPWPTTDARSVVSMGTMGSSVPINARVTAARREPPQPHDDLGWVGGRRAIILRD